MTVAAPPLTRADVLSLSETAQLLGIAATALGVSPDCVGDKIGPHQLTRERIEEIQRDATKELADLFKEQMTGDPDDVAAVQRVIARAKTLARDRAEQEQERRRKELRR